MCKNVILYFLFCLVSSIANADEGFWLPNLLKQMNESHMKDRGMKISADDIYQANHTSLKDAVLLFGGGCSGAVVSSQGLLLTNYHCGNSSVQAVSTKENDYLTNGFWAKKKEEELPCPGLTVQFVIRIEDVTKQIISQLDSGMSETERESRMKSMARILEKKAIEGTHYGAITKPFFYGTAYYMIVTETFSDIRLVGAPPSAIGKFGSETDNWVWPQQKGDFAMFRIYAGLDNKPASYSKENKPFVPRNHLKINLNGVNENDFTMVYGFPGRSTEYLPSYAIDLAYTQSNPVKINLRETRLRLMDEGMHIHDSIYKAYSVKYSSLSNHYKKWQGEQVGLKRNNTLKEKEEQELIFGKWAIQDADRKKKFSNLMPDFERAYFSLKPLAKVNDYLVEGLNGIELVNMAANFNEIVLISEKDTVDTEKLKAVCKKIAGSKGFFNNYHLLTDKKICLAMLTMYYANIEKTMRPDVFKIIENKFKGSIEKYTDYLYQKTWLINQEKVAEMLSNFKPADVKKITTDPAFVLYKSIAVFQDSLRESYAFYANQVTKLQRLYMTGLLEMKPNHTYYPDANLTLRVSYGNIKGFEPRDGIWYNYFTTLEGVIQKADSTSTEFAVPEKLRNLYEHRDYGRYGQNGKMHIAFIANNHTTGGNSGSAVLNSKGELIGINFDRAWEGVMSDYKYDPEICRNITLDIRYILFIIDKFASAGNLVDEMTIVE